MRRRVGQVESPDADARPTINVSEGRGPQLTWDTKTSVETRKKAILRREKKQNKAYTVLTNVCCSHIFNDNEAGIAMSALRKLEWNRQDLFSCLWRVSRTSYQKCI